MLAASKLPATPTNYAQMYQRIAAAGGSTSASATAYEAFEELAGALSNRGLAQRLRDAVRLDDWKAVNTLLATALEQNTGQSTVEQRASAGVAALIGRLTQQIDIHHPGTTVSRKRDGLRRALVPRNEGVDDLIQRLNRLVESWSNTSQVMPDESGEDAASAHAADGRVDGRVEGRVEPRLSGSAAGAPTTGSLTPEQEATRSRRQPISTTDPSAQRLRTLLQLVLQNVSELTPEAALLNNQVEVIGRVLLDPLTEQKLDEAERLLRTLIIRQGTIKHGIEEAKFAAKELVGSLVDRLATLSATAGSYSGKIHDHAERIAKAENLTQLSQLVTTLLSDTRLMSSDMLRARDDLDAARAKTRQLEERTLTLEAELARASALVRIDPLTEALNRRGFEEVYAQELSRTNRSTAVPNVCVAILDVDNFKRINDSYGHIAGDDALRHLISVIREITRPTDAVGRYGGEEFVVLFPDTPVEEAVSVMTRVQRELTRRVFLQENSRILITFSCGVTAIGAGESLETVLERADRSLQDAKNTGKNKVVVGTRTP